PVLLKFTGKSQYGLFQLIGSVIAYMAIMDFGLSGTITRYYSRYLALDDQKNQANILALSTLIYSAITVLILITGVIIYLNLDTIFSNSLTAFELYKARQLFVIMLVNVAITIPTQIFTAVINAYERFIFIRLLSIIQTLLQPFVVTAIMIHIADVLVLVLVQTLFNLITIVLKMYYSFSKLKIKIKLYTWDKLLIIEMMSFSFFVFLNMIVDQVYWKTDQIILGIISGTSAVALYSIAAQLDGYYINFSSNINNVFLPIISAISAKTEDMSEINRIFNKVGRIQFAIMSLILTGFTLYGKEFIGFWAGDDFKPAYYMALIVMVPALIPLIENMGINILQAKNKHAFRAKIYLFMAVLNVILTIPLAKLYGGIGCAVSTAFAHLIGHVIIMNIYYHKKIGIDIIAFAREILSMCLPVIISLVIGAMGNYLIKTNDIKILALKITGYTLTYTILMWFKGFNDYEKGLFRSWFKK
ncbi:MAG: oligosaccharide flippase family protein, partial [Tissierella sp.]|nr:oligosaccharide flippase family protein [Tissierella sp.]